MAETRWPAPPRPRIVGQAMSALAVLALGALGTGVAFALATRNAGRLGSTHASVTIYITPGVSLVLGVALRSEKVAALAVVGAAIALLGAYLTNRVPRPSA
jgi:drug/metabolite transporter (DMT)-like permease